jgi:hypothetical protein
MNLVSLWQEYGRQGKITYVSQNLYGTWSQRRGITCPGIGLPLRRIDYQSSLHGFDHTGELGQETIVTGTYRMAAMLMYPCGYQLQGGREDLHHTDLILFNEPAIALYVSVENGGDLALHTATRFRSQHRKQS